MRSCCIATCQTGHTLPSGVIIHRFPKNDSQRHLWMSMVKTHQPSNKAQINSYYGICSLHFPSDCYDHMLIRTSQRCPLRRLKKGAVPSLLLVSFYVKPYDFLNKLYISIIHELR